MPVDGFPKVRSLYIDSGLSGSIALFVLQFGTNGPSRISCDYLIKYYMRNINNADDSKDNSHVDEMIK